MENYILTDEEKFIIETINQYLYFTKNGVCLDGDFSVYDLKQIIKISERVTRDWKEK